MDPLQKATENTMYTMSIISDLLECGFSHVNDLAHLILSSKDDYASEEKNDNTFYSVPLVDNENFLSVYNEAKQSLEEINIGKDVSKDAATFLSGITKNISVSLKAFLCKEICKKRAEKGKEITIYDFFPDSGIPLNERIAYVRNPLSDEAYSIFSEYLENPMVLYPHNFAGACEEVYYGRCGYCILPYENNDEGVLSGFKKLIIKYELTPVMMCQVVSGIDETNVTRFVLLSKTPHKILKDEDKDAHLMLRITVDNPEANEMANITTIANIFGLVYNKTENYPSALYDGQYSETLVFEIANGDIIPFLLYLNLEVPSGTIDGIYVLIEN